MWFFLRSKDRISSLSSLAIHGLSAGLRHVHILGTVAKWRVETTTDHLFSQVLNVTYFNNETEFDSELPLQLNPSPMNPGRMAHETQPTALS